MYSSSVLGPRLVAVVVESSEVVASRRFLLHYFNGSSVELVAREVGRFSERSLREVSLYSSNELLATRIVSHVQMVGSKLDFLGSTHWCLMFGMYIFCAGHFTYFDWHWSH